MNSIIAIHKCAEIAALFRQSEIQAAYDGIDPNHRLRRLGYLRKPSLLKCMEPRVLINLNKCLKRRRVEVKQLKDYEIELKKAKESYSLIMDDVMKLYDAISLFSFRLTDLEQLEKDVQAKQRLERLVLIADAKSVSNTLHVSERPRFWDEINKKVSVRYASSVDESLDQIPVVKRYLKELECLLAEKKAMMIDTEVLIGHLTDELKF